jgi:UPF0755 protein
LIRKLLAWLLTLVVTLLSLALLAVGAAAGYLAWELGRPLDPDAAPVRFKVERGRSLLATSRELERQGLLRHSWTFRVLNRLARERAAVQAGLFELSAARSPAQLFQDLRFGRPILRSITIIEGLTLPEIARTLQAETEGHIQAAEALALMQDPALAKELGVEQQNLEGYLLPETYLVPYDMPVRQLLGLMVQSHFKALPANYREREAELGLTHHQLVTLASLVEAETPLDEEKTRVAEVFYKRHAKGMRLQCDPTTVYGVEDHKPPITRKDLERDHPYNTYLYPGLPPGPINNPGRQALVASLEPADEGNYYFVALADGSRGHHFSKTLQEHNRAVARYRQRIRVQRAEQQRERAGQARRGQPAPAAGQGTGPTAPTGPGEAPAAPPPEGAPPTPAAGSGMPPS